ncbi:MAG: hypothetical protein R2724_02055 [Bryobacterales bacterium]
MRKAPAALAHGEGSGGNSSKRASPSKRTCHTSRKCSVAFEPPAHTAPSGVWTDTPYPSGRGNVPA